MEKLIELQAARVATLNQQALTAERTGDVERLALLEFEIAEAEAILERLRNA